MLQYKKLKLKEGRSTEQEDKNKFYKMFILFSHGTTHDRKRLLHSYPEELADEAIAKGYIIELREDEWDVPVYEITSFGAKVWE